MNRKWVNSENLYFFQTYIEKRTNFDPTKNPLFGYRQTNILIERIHRIPFVAPKICPVNYRIAIPIEFLCSINQQFIRATKKLFHLYPNTKIYSDQPFSPFSIHFSISRRHISREKKKLNKNIYRNDWTKRSRTLYKPYNNQSRCITHVDHSLFWKVFFND